ncbi:MAG TPA: response regulator [Candidatus Dormibacteraeota bacterium]|nr:response regulator [Candidatus Dormibacteraeota bacterium]
MTIRVLVADDSKDMRELVRASLQAYGDFEVVGEASTGAEAVELASSLDPEVVILDLSMPVMGGLAALPAIRAAAPDTRVVVLSAFNKEEFGAKAASLGAEGYGVKGMHPKALAGLVERSMSDGRPRVIVVEEDAAAWAPYVVALRAAGCEVARAASVKEAVTLIRYRNFDLVVLGMALPDGPGIDVLEALAALDPQMPLPVIVTLSGPVDAATVNRAFHLGAVASLSTRTLSAEQLGAGIGKWLEKGSDLRSA